MPFSLQQLNFSEDNCTIIWAVFMQFIYTRLERDNQEGTSVRIVEEPQLAVIHIQILFTN